MANDSPIFWSAYNAREDLQVFGDDSLLLFALELKFEIEDIATIAVNSVTDGTNDKKVDLVYIDSESGYAVIAQTYVSKDLNKKEAPANKASDLNTGVSWLLNRPIEELPVTIKSHAEELRNAIKDGSINCIHIWYVHNLPESSNVLDELKTVELSTKSIISSNFGALQFEIHAQEVGVNTINDWYQSLLTPILVNEDFVIPIDGGFMIGGDDWSAYVTSIPAIWLYEKYREHTTKLFSANVRDYLGSRKTDNNINYGIKQTAHNDPQHFWVYNNGITALVHNFEEKRDDGKLQIHFRGISIVNGAQTTGAIGNLGEQPNSSAMVQIRFIQCQADNTIYNIVRYNNSQNKIAAPDFRSNDSIQKRLREEFKSIPLIEYLPRRGGHEDIMRYRPNVLPSVTAGQALAAFHKNPETAYHMKTNIWESDSLYSTYFNDQTTAKHILLAYALLRAIESKKINLYSKSQIGSLTEIEEAQLEFYRKRGSILMMAAAISRCLEILLDRQIPNSFRLHIKNNVNLSEGIDIWRPIVEIASSFSKPLAEGLLDGFRAKETVENSIEIFQSLISATKQVNKQIYDNFAENIGIS